MWKPRLVFFSVWALAGFGAVIGSILGNAWGTPGLFAGAVAGGILGVGGAVAAVTGLGWLPRPDRPGAVVGGIAGFALAAPIAVATLHTPVMPALICGLAGAGALLGVGLARGWTRRP